MYCCIRRLFPFCAVTGTTHNVHVKTTPSPYLQDGHSVRLPHDNYPNDNKLCDKLCDCDKLKSATFANTRPFIPPVHSGKVIKVYDGDTITIAACIPIIGEPDCIYRFSVRLAGIDTAEIKSKNPVEKELAQKSRELMHSLVFGKTVYLENVGIEKYGRLLADIYIDTDANATDVTDPNHNKIHVNEWMLLHGYAKKYDGGTKEGFIDVAIE